MKAHSPARSPSIAPGQKVIGATLILSRKILKAASPTPKRSGRSFPPATPWRRWRCASSSTIPTSAPSFPACASAATSKPTSPPAPRAPSPPPSTNSSAPTAGTATQQVGANEKPLQLAHCHSERSEESLFGFELRKEMRREERRRGREKLTIVFSYFLLTAEN